MLAFQARDAPRRRDPHGAPAAPRFVLDIRDVDGNTAGGSWLAEPRETRSIGCCYEQDEPENYWYSERTTDLYDVLIRFEETGATTVLPFYFSLFDTDGPGGR